MSKSDQISQQIRELQQTNEALQQQLDSQKGMLWLLGEVIKIVTSIESFRELMEVVTDMLMGVTGVNRCYIWLEDYEKTKVYMRSTHLENHFIEEAKAIIPVMLYEVNHTTLLEDEAITFSLEPEAKLPRTRLIIPLIQVEGQVMGGMILEQGEVGFFNPHNIAFFEMLGVLVAARTQHTKSYERMLKECRRDPLTGVYNRRHLTQVLEEYGERNEALAISVIDIDNFKKVNDLHGHLVGDCVLKAISDEAKRFFRLHGGKVIRYGGDEFVVVLPKGLERCKPIFEAFQQSIPHIAEVLATKVAVTVTMGVCTYPELTQNKEMLLQKADDALIKGKACSKNQVIFAEV